MRCLVVFLVVLMTGFASSGAVAGGAFIAKGVTTPIAASADRYSAYGIDPADGPASIKVCNTSANPGEFTVNIKPPASLAPVLKQAVAAGECVVVDFKGYGIGLAPAAGWSGTVLFY